MITNGGQMTYTKSILQEGDKILIIIDYQYNTEYTETNDGFSFYTTDGSTVDYYNKYTSNLTITNYNDVPMAKNGYQFSDPTIGGLTDLTLAPNSGYPKINSNIISEPKNIFATLFESKFPKNTRF